MRGVKEDLTGHTFNRLTVLRYINRTYDSLWECRCSCGRLVTVGAAAMKRGNTKSCGCWNDEVRIKKATTHGLSHLPEYFVWSVAKDRCHNPRSNAYRNYGGRGIYMSEAWRHDFATFYRDMGPRPSITHSLDRIDNNGPYAKENCRWATPHQQRHNKRTSRRVVINGVSGTLTELVDMLPVARETVYARMKRGLTLEDAIHKPSRNRKRHNRKRG